MLGYSVAPLVLKRFSTVDLFFYSPGSVASVFISVFYCSKSNLFEVVAAHQLIDNGLPGIKWMVRSS